MSDAPSDPTAQRFGEDVREFASLDDHLRDASRESKPMRDAKKKLEASILTYMDRMGISTCNIPGGRLTIKVHKRKEALTPETLLPRLVDFFEGREDRAAECLEHLTAERPVRERRMLKRVRGGSGGSGGSDDGRTA